LGSSQRHYARKRIASHLPLIEDKGQQFLFLGYSGHSTKNSEKLIENGIHLNIFASRDKSYSLSFSAGGHLFTFVIQIDDFADAVNRKLGTTYTSDQIKTTPGLLKEILDRGAHENKTPLTGDYPREYDPLSKEICRLALILDVRIGPDKEIVTPLDIMVRQTLSAAGYQKAETCLGQIWNYLTGKCA
jgi:hypothetical protein